MTSIEAANWDVAYAENQRYHGDPPIAFVDTILNELGESGKSQIGLYVGCGNGRNFVPLAEHGLNLSGVDISKVALEQLKERYPEARAYQSDFSDIRSAHVFDYVISIQAFQHGDVASTDNMFNLAKMALKPQGKLFLRVNSASTEVFHDHEIIEGQPQTGRTVLYDPNGDHKPGQKVRFYTKEELEALAARNSFAITQPLTERTERRKLPQEGTWAQWESIWQKV